MKTITRLSMLLATALLILSSCSGEETTKSVNIASQMSQSESRSLKEADDFGEKFFTAAVKAVPEGNMLMSPLSTQILLGMVSNAATGQTRAEITSALGCTSVADLNSALSKIIASLPFADRDAKVSCANAVWHSYKETLNPAFVSPLEANYGPVVRSTDFTKTTEAAEAINSWVSKETGKIIDNIVPPAALENAVLFMANALYFNGRWTKTFDSEKTKKGTFHGAAKDSEVEMMNKTFDTSVAYYDNCRIVRLPFGNQSFYIDFLLPDEGIGCNSAIESHNLTATKKVKLTLSLPKMKCTTGYGDEMKALLTELGCGNIFRDNDMQFFTNDPSAMKRFIQKSSLEINEEGARFAAATGGTGELTALPAEGADTMVFDRPFALILGEATTGVTLCVGRITDL